MSAMAKSGAEAPLLVEHVNSTFQSSGDNIITKRESSRYESIPAEEIYPPHESVSSSKLDLKKVLAFSTAYFALGTLCFFLVRNEIKGKKTNGIIDAIYFCVVTMTTVGYGDLVPNSVMSKLIACLFVFSGMALVGFLLSRAADYFVEKQEILLVKAIHMREKCSPFEILKEVETNKAKHKFLTSLVLFIVLVIAGTLFLYLKEGLELFDAFYCVCATVTTLGYGDKSFSTSGGRVFASFWILTSTICLAQLLCSIAELYTERRRKSLVNWILTRKLTVSDLEAADLDHDKVVSPAEFIVYKLKEMGKITEEDVALVMEGFKNLDVNHSGTLTKADLVNPESSNT